MMYIILMCLLAWRALDYYQSCPSISSACGVTGALLFLLSDLTIAYDKWVGDLNQTPMVVMVTYYIAQLGIALAVAAYKPPAWVKQEEGNQARKRFLSY